MSGYTKTTIYRVIDWALWLGAVAGSMLLFFFLPSDLALGEFLAGLFLVLTIALRIPATIHETGHLLAAMCGGFGIHSFTVSLFTVTGKSVSWTGYDGDCEGFTEFYPKHGKGLRKRYIFLALAGGGLTLLLGILLLGLSLGLSYRPIALYFAMLSLFLIGDGLRAYYPASLPEGETDGSVALGAIKNTPDFQVTLAVLTAHGILYRGQFSDIPRSVLFDTPVVREDHPAFFELLRLRMLFLLSEGDRAGASETFERMRSLREYFPESFARAEGYEPCLSGEPPLPSEEEFTEGELALRETLSKQ